MGKFLASVLILALLLIGALKISTAVVDTVLALTGSIQFSAVSGIAAFILLIVGVILGAQGLDES